MNKLLLVFMPLLFLLACQKEEQTKLNPDYISFEKSGTNKNLNQAKRISLPLVDFEQWLNEPGIQSQNRNWLKSKSNELLKGEFVILENVFIFIETNVAVTDAPNLPNNLPFDPSEAELVEFEDVITLFVIDVDGLALAISKLSIPFNVIDWNFPSNERIAIIHEVESPDGSNNPIDPKVIELDPRLDFDDTDYFIGVEVEKPTSGFDGDWDDAVLISYCMKHFRFYSYRIPTTFGNDLYVWMYLCTSAGCEDFWVKPNSLYTNSVCIGSQCNCPPDHFEIFHF